MPQLDVHVASDAERREAFANVYDVWSSGPTLAEHVARRLRSAQHARARWFVGGLDGRVVSSLGAYPLRFRVHGRSYSGVAVGAVHTLAEYRGQGLASQLLRNVESQLRSAGVQMVMLYSDIDPLFYQRLGYHLCPAWQAETVADGGELSKTGIADAPDPPREDSQLDTANRRQEVSAGDPSRAATTLRLERCHVPEDLEELRSLYAATHSDLPLAIERDTAYWDWLVARFPSSQWFRVRENVQTVGFVQVEFEDAGTRCRLRQWALSDRSALGSLLDAVRAWGQTLNGGTAVSSFAGWLPDVPAVRARLALTRRVQEIPMLKPLGHTLPLDRAAMEAAGWLHAADHV